ncbi:hypothetical protein [Pseudonocardia alni]|nr:hypothetical protein [Pseudonocardia alni]NWJ75098.1 hypothetical protein [Pseudonocardia pini]
MAVLEVRLMGAAAPSEPNPGAVRHGALEDGAGRDRIGITPTALRGAAETVVP